MAQLARHSVLLLTAALLAAAPCQAAYPLGNQRVLEIVQRGPKDCAAASCPLEGDATAEERSMLLDHKEHAELPVQYRHGTMADVNTEAGSGLPNFTADGWNAVLFQAAASGALTLGHAELRRDTIRHRVHNWGSRTPVLGIPCGLWRPESGWATDPPLTAFEHCPLVVVTGAAGAEAVQLPAVPSAGEGSLESCFVAFLDVTAAAAMQQLAGGRANAWTVVVVTQAPFGVPALNAAIPKHLPHVLFPKAHWSVWVDPGTSLSVDPAALVVQYGLRYNADVALGGAGQRLGADEEAEWAVAEGRVARSEVNAQLSQYSAKGSPTHAAGLPDSRVIIRRHASLAAALVGCAWWNEVERHPHGDGLSFAHVLHQLGFAPQQLPPQALVEARDAGCLKVLQYDWVSPVLQGRVHMLSPCQLAHALGQPVSEQPASEQRSQWQRQVEEGAREGAGATGQPGAADLAAGARKRQRLYDPMARRGQQEGHT